MADLDAGLEDDGEDEDDVDSHVQTAAAEDRVCNAMCSSCSSSLLFSCDDSHRLEAAKVDVKAAAAAALTRDCASRSMYRDAMLAMLLESNLETTGGGAVHVLGGRQE